MREGSNLSKALRLARRRPKRGITSIDLAPELGIAPNEASVVLRRLMEGGHLTREPTRYTANNGANVAGYIYRVPQVSRQ